MGAYVTIEMGLEDIQSLSKLLYKMNVADFRELLNEEEVSKILKIRENIFEFMIKKQKE